MIVDAYDNFLSVLSFTKDERRGRDGNYNPFGVLVYCESLCLSYLGCLFIVSPLAINFRRMRHHLSRIEKKGLDKIYVFLDVESESAIKSRGSHLRFQRYSQPHSQGRGREAANFCRIELPPRKY